MDVGDYVFGKALGPLQFCLIGKWKTKPNPYPETKVMEVWFREAWRLNGEVLLAALNKDLFLLEFDSPEKAKWVLESGRRSFKGGAFPSFESCWEKGLSLVPAESLAMGGSGQGNGDEGFSDGRSLALVEAGSMRPEVADPKAL